MVMLGGSVAADHTDEERGAFGEPGGHQIRPVLGSMVDCVVFLKRAISFGSFANQPHTFGVNLVLFVVEEGAYVGV